MTYALAFYNLIPERVMTLTSITPKRNKFFSTPVGNFEYRYLTPTKYPMGITLHFLDEKHPILIATPEKALMDQVLLASPGLELTSKDDVETYLFEDLRIDEEELKKLKPNKIRDIATLYKKHSTTWVAQYLCGDICFNDDN